MSPCTKGHGESRWLGHAGGKHPISPRLEAGAKPEPQAAELTPQERQENGSSE